jgi:hypothetical protein
MYLTSAIPPDEEETSTLSRRFPKTNMDPNLEHSIQIQQKFEFYFLALVFTVLGLSIQTAEFSSRFQAGCEIAAWLSLLASGLAGLSRMEWIAVAYKGHSQLVHRKTFLQQAGTGRSLVAESGQRMSSAEANQFLKEVAGRVTEGESAMQRIEHRHWMKTFIHKWFFVGGLVLLMISRGVGLWCSVPEMVQ